MAKYLVIFLILAGVALFYPFRDLYVLEDEFTSTYALAGEGYWSAEACVEAAKARQAKDFHCRKRTMFAQMMGNSTRYARVGVENIE